MDIPHCARRGDSPACFYMQYTHAVTHGIAALAELFKTLSTIHTPQPVIDAIRHGLNHWLQNPDSSLVRALTSGSLRGSDVILTSAFYEQTTDIGWYQMCLGRVSKKWASAVVQSSQPSPPRDGGLNWSSLFIAALWQFSRALWKRRNEEVHGATVEEQATRQLAQLRDSITTMYNQFNENQAIILPRYRYLFTSNTLENRLKGSYDTMAAWLRSVEEAIQVLQYQEANYQAEARRFFPPSANAAYFSKDSDSTYTYQSSASDGTLSFEPTVVTTVTSTTMSSAISSASVIQYLVYDSDDESLTSVMTSDSVFQPDQDTNTMLSAALTASANAELSLATLFTSTIDHSTFTSQEDEESTTVASGGTDHSGQISSVDSSFRWANP
jgi:hypothetical protein